ncbi:calcium-binding protein [Niveispirillum sp. KHB5.9]|uniref:calcium-binding protein n=1 Tax=Niveispirillum sp. KHB5.9 TaxID=3400269 RepID=UPI003A849A1B
MSGTLRAGTPNDDTLYSLSAGDTLAGGAGNDTYDVLHYGTVIREEAGGDSADLVVAHIDFVLPDFVEDLTMEYADRGHIPNPVTSGPQIGIGNALDNDIQGNALDNFISALGGDDFVRAGGGDDLVLGGTGHDLLLGDSGDDILLGEAGNDLLNGGTGDDLLIAGLGEDRLIGSEGLDIAVFSSPASHYQFTVTGAQTFVTNTHLPQFAESADMRGVEIAVFGTDVKLLTPHAPGTARNGFDEALYLSRYGDVAVAVRNGAVASGWEHFQLYGEREGRDPNALFDVGFYLANNQDVAAAVAGGQTTAWSHYSNYGWKEGRDPSAFFNTRAYLATNDDVGASGLNPLLHYLYIGAADGRLAQLSNPTMDWIG